MKNEKEEALEAGNPYAKKELLPKYLFKISHWQSSPLTIYSPYPGKYENSAENSTIFDFIYLPNNTQEVNNSSNIGRIRP